MRFVLTARVKMSIKIRVHACFQLHPGDFRHFTPEPCYDVEVAEWWNVAGLRVEVFQTWLISCLRYNVEFYRDWFGAGDQLKDEDDVLEDGATDLFAVVSLKEQI